MWQVIKNFLFGSKKRVTLLCVALLIVAFLSGYAAYDYYFVTGLASDEEMIAQFYEHKAELEMVVKQFRTFGRYDVKLLKSANGFSLRAANDTRTLSRLRWIPDSYPMEQYEPIDKKKSEARLEGGYKLKPEESWELRYRYGAVYIRMRPQKKYNKETLRYSYIEKDLFHLPDITAKPWEEEFGRGDFLRWKPADDSWSGSLTNYLLPSLNRIPTLWSGGSSGCVFREIEPHWYIGMCANKRQNIHIPLF